MIHNIDDITGYLVYAKWAAAKKPDCPNLAKEVEITERYVEALHNLLSARNAYMSAMGWFQERKNGVKSRNVKFAHDQLNTAENEAAYWKGKFEIEIGSIKI